MKYFIDTEFHEYSKKNLFSKKGTNTIELISIGIVCEDGREYYAISKDFDLKSACYNEWLRKNVLKPIWEDLRKNQSISNKDLHFKYKSLKYLINKYGKSNKQIAEEVKMFVYEDGIYSTNKIQSRQENIEFYGYYSDYDWVVFCWLFGRMIDLPKGFPMYCIDLKQTLDEKVDKHKQEWLANKINIDFDMLNHIKTLPNYPKQINEHNALADARFNKELFNFLNNL